MRRVIVWVGRLAAFPYSSFFLGGQVNLWPGGRDRCWPSISLLIIHYSKFLNIKILTKAGLTSVFYKKMSVWKESF